MTQATALAPRAPRRRRGAPRTAMTVEVVATVLRHVRSGSYPEEAARAAGVKPSAMRMLKSRNKAFAADLEKAVAVSELSLVATVQRASIKDASNARWLLERRWPQRWARPEIRADLNITNISAADIVAGIHKGLKMLAAQHAPFDEPDVDGDSHLSSLEQATKAAADGQPPTPVTRN